MQLNGLIFISLVELSLLLNGCWALCDNSWWSDLHFLEIQVTLNKAPRFFDTMVEKSMSIENKSVD